jgi:UDP-N-acetylmuramate dehydrogenase
MAVLLEALGSLPRCTVREQAPLGALTTYRVGGPAAVVIEVPDEAALVDLARVTAAAAEAGALPPVLVLGRGSNLLVSDRGFDGVVVVPGDGFTRIDIEGTRVEAGAAVSLPVLARQTAAAGLSGLEWAVGVPGSVGGAVRMNAGGHGSDTAATLERFRGVDLATATAFDRAGAELGADYRRTSLAPLEVVTAAVHRLEPGDPALGAARIAEIVRWRREHQPGGSNAGSVFANPPGDAAGRLIEACGLRGYRSGTASVSGKHANFIVADDGGSADDVMAVVRHVQRTVEERTGIRLRTEVRLVGFDGPDIDGPDRGGTGPRGEPDHTAAGERAEAGR